MLCRNGARGRIASIKKCAVIVSGVRRQPNGVECPPVCHGLRWPGEVFHHGTPCLAALNRELEIRRSNHAPSSLSEGSLSRTDYDSPPPVTESACHTH